MKDLFTSPKALITKLLAERLGRLVIDLPQEKKLYVVTDEILDLLISVEVKKERKNCENECDKRCVELEKKLLEENNQVQIDRLTMAQQTLLKFGNKFQIFNNMSDEELLSVTDNIQVLKMEKGEKVFSINNTTKEMFYIINGSVRVLIEGDKEVAILNQGSFFGEMAYIANKPRNATVVVTSNIALLLSFKLKENISPDNAKAFSKLFQNINYMLSDKIEQMNRKI